MVNRIASIGLAVVLSLAPRRLSPRRAGRDLGLRNAENRARSLLALSTAEPPGTNPPFRSFPEA